MAYHRGMIFRRYGTFTGGIDLPDEKGATLDEAIVPCRLPAELRVPLAPCAGRAAEPIVRLGQHVRAGERIGRAADAGGVDVFAPLSGRVGPIVPAEVAGGHGFVESPAVALTELDGPAAAFDADGSPQADPLDWQAAEAGAICERISAGSLTTFRPRPQPLGSWVGRARENRCGTLVANAMEQEPYVTADHRLLVDRGADVVEGLAILRKAVGADEAILAADRRRTGAYEALMQAAERFGVTRIALPHKYPMGADTILVKVLTRRETPPGRSTMAVGAAVVDAATCRAVFQWVCRGVRPLGRVVTVAGDRAAAPANLWVPFGADCVELTGGAEGLIVHGGPMSGLRCGRRAVVTAATCAVLALSPPATPLPTVCIRCGWCTDHCPVRLNVTALNDAFELSLVGAARRGGAPACVECGVCSYVCPARLPLAQRVKQLKQAIRVAEVAQRPVGREAQ